MRLKSLLLFGVKLWILGCVGIVFTQVRYGGDTVLHHLDEYFDSPVNAKHFAKILYPIHLVLSQVGVDVGWDKVQRTIAYHQSNEEKIKATFGAEAGKQMEKYKQAAQEQKQVLDSIESEIAH